MYATRPHLSCSLRLFQAGIAPLPSVIFQKSSPAVWFFPEAVRSLGFGFKEAPTGPSPFPACPWQLAQLDAYSVFPAAAACAASPAGGVRFFASAGAVQDEAVAWLLLGAALELEPDEPQAAVTSTAMATAATLASKVIRDMFSSLLSQ